MKYALLALAIAFNVSAYLVFKSISAKSYDLLWAGFFAAGLALGAVNVFFFTAALRELKLAVAYLAGAVLVVFGIVFLSR